MPTPSVPSAVVVVRSLPGNSAPKYASAQASASPPSATSVALPPNRPWTNDASSRATAPACRRSPECSSTWRFQKSSDAEASERARASHSSLPGGAAVHASRRSRITDAMSPTTMTSAARLPPMRSGAISTCKIVCSVPKSGAPPYMTLALNAEPSTSTQSAVGMARPPWTSEPRLQACESGTTPRAALAVITGIRARSANPPISAPAFDQNEPLPAMMIGRSAAASAATAAPTSAGAPDWSARSLGKAGRSDLEGSRLSVQGMRIHLEIHAAGAATSRSMQRLGDVSGYPSGVGAARRPLCDRCSDGALVHVGDRTAALPVAAGATAEHHQRNAPDRRINKPDQAVREPWSGGNRGDPGVPGRQRPPLGGEDRGALMAGIDNPDVRVDAGVEKGQDVSAGKGENGGHAPFTEGSRHQRAAVVTLFGVGARSLGRDVRHGFAVYRPGLAAGTARRRG